MNALRSKVSIKEDVLVSASAFFENNIHCAEKTKLYERDRVLSLTWMPRYLWIVFFCEPVCKYKGIVFCSSCSVRSRIYGTT